MTGPSSNFQRHHSPSASPLLKQVQFHGSTSTLGSTISFGSMTSAYSAAGGKGNYNITGEVLLTIGHTGQQLEVVVGRARSLAATKKGSSNPYVKTYLLPDRNKISKQKTSVKKGTLNPVYNETLKYDVPLSEVALRTLWVSIWDWDRFGRNQFLGEVRLPLSSADLSDPKQHWHTLQDKDENSGIDDFVRGELKLGLMFQLRPTTANSDAAGHGTLNIFIKEARDLPAMNSNGLADTVVKCYLLPDQRSVSKRKTGVIKNNLSPVWEEKFCYEGVALRELLSERVLEITLWHHDRHGNEFIGGMRMGGAPGRSPRQKKWMDAIGLEVSHWEDMLKCPGKWTEQWHTLRPSMVPREVDLSQIPPPFTIPSLSTPPSQPCSDVESSTNPHPLPNKTLEITELSADVVVAGGADTTPPSAVSDVHDVSSSLSKQTDVSPFPSSKESGITPSLSQPVFVTQQADVPPSPSQQADISPSPSQRTDNLPSFSSISPSSSQLADASPSPFQRDALPSSSQTTDIPSSFSQQADIAPSSFQPLPPSLIGQQTDVPPSPSQHPPPPILTQQTDINGRDWQDPFETEPKSKTRDLSVAHRAGLLGLNTAGGSATSFGSMSSIYSAAGGKGDYDITGEVLFGVHFKNGQLMVHINRARGLAAADSNGYSDPYVKAYLLPDKTKSTKKKTDIKKKTLNPVYNHTIKYNVLQDQLSTRTLWLSVWDWDRFGKNQFLGEIRLPLSSVDLSDTTDRWYNLQDKDGSEEDGRTHRGELRVAMMFEQLSSKKEKSKGTLHITVNQAKNLSNLNSTAKTDSFVKCYLLPDKSSSGKRKTRVIKANSDPVWEESFSYEKLNLEDLMSERGLEITVWDFSKGSSNEFIGGLRIGPSPSTGKRKEWMDSIGEELKQWESVMSNPGQWTDTWHTLRTTMNYRIVA